MPAGLADESRAQIAEMFAREARLLQRCTHERIARILDFFHENDREYLVLQLIDGVPLSGLMHRSDGSVRVSEKQVRLWAWQLTEFLVHLHGLDPPIIHRDFTPDNLLLHQSGDIYLIDFGAANEFIGQATGTLIGKQSYIPLEQLQGKALPQSDIYALGGTIYFLLSGCDPLPLTELHPREDGYECSVELDELVGQCTRLDKDQRISSATEVLRQLSSFVG